MHFLEISWNFVWFGILSQCFFIHLKRGQRYRWSLMFARHSLM